MVNKIKNRIKDINKIEAMLKKPKFGVMAKKSKSKLNNLISIILIILLYIGLFYLLRGKLLFTPDFGESDAYHLNLSLKYLLFDSLKNNTIPFWTDKLQGGFPIFAEGQIGALFLPNLFFLKFFSFTDGYNLLLIFSLFSLTLGMYLFLREFEIDIILSSLAALVFTFGGAISLRWVHLNLIQTFSLFPLLFLAYIRFTKNPKARYFILFSFLLSQMIYAGHLQTVFICLLSIFFYCLTNIFLLKAKFNQLLKFCLLVASGMILALPQILPTLALISQSSRQFMMNYSSATSFPLTFGNLLTFVSPYMFGNPKTGTYPPFSNNWGIFWENTPYLGPLFFAILTVSLIFFIISTKKKNINLVKIIVLNIFVFLLLALGKNSPIYFIFELFPFNLFRTPSKYLLMVHFYLIFLIAFLIKFTIERLKNKILVYLIYILFVISVFQLVSFTFSYHLFVNKDTLLKSPSLAKFDNKFYYFTLGQEALWNESFIKKGWSSKESINKYIFLKNFLYPNSGVLFDKKSTAINTGGFRLKRSDYLNAFILKKIIKSNEELKIDSSLKTFFDIYNMNYLISPVEIKSDQIKLEKKVSLKKSTIYLYSFNNNYSSYTIPARLYKMNSLIDFENAYEDGDLNIESAFIERSYLNNSLNNKNFNLQIIEDKESKISLSGKFKDKTFLVFKKNYYPEWNVLIDDRQVPIVKTNLTQIGVWVPKGSHTIILEYKNFMFYLGLVVFLVYFAILVLYLLLRKRFQSFKKLSGV